MTVCKLFLIEEVIEKGKQIGTLGALIREAKDLPDCHAQNLGQLLCDLAEEVYEPLEEHFDILVDKNKKGSLSSSRDDKEPENGSSRSGIN